jgi:hypothetical protein
MFPSQYNCNWRFGCRIFPVVQLDFEGLIVTDLSSNGMNCSSPAPEYLPTLHLHDGLNQIIHCYTPQTSLKIPHPSNTPARSNRPPLRPSNLPQDPPSFKHTCTGHGCGCGLASWTLAPLLSPELRVVGIPSLFGKLLRPNYAQFAPVHFLCAFRQGTARLTTQESRIIWIHRECG